MNKYPIWLGIAVAAVMVCVTSNYAWWMVVAVGIGANGIAVAANGWKMPVRGQLEEGIRHAPMTGSTRFKCFGDVIPVGFGKASIGDFLIWAGLMGVWATRGSIPYEKLVAASCLLWWASGWAKGFNLFKKWPAEARRDARKNIPIVLVLMALGNLVNLRGCSFGDLRASAESLEGIAASAPSPVKPKVIAQEKWRDLGKLAPLSPAFLTRLKLESAANVREGKARAEEEAKRKAFDPKKAFEHEEKRIEAKARPAFEREQKQADAVRAAGIGSFPGYSVNCDRNGSCAVSDGDKVFLTVRGGDYLPSSAGATTAGWMVFTQSSTAGTVTISNPATMNNSGTMQPIGTRKGPFCRVTCTFTCHQPGGSGSADAETDAKYCKQQHIPDDVVSVMGWVDAGNGYEYQSGWPGPASEPGALKYKLYWKP